MNVCSLYDMSPDVYDEYMDTQIEHQNYATVLHYLHDVTSENENVTILDLCCGTGLVPRNWLPKLDTDYSYIGIDNNETFLNQARKHLDTDNHRFIHDDATTVQVDTDVDVILATSAYHHITDDHKIQFLQNAHHHIRASGTFILYEKIIHSFTSEAEQIRAGTEFYKERIADMITEEALTEIQVFALFNELYLTAIRDEEYKVPYERIIHDFQQARFEHVREDKLWPDDDRFDNEHVGDFVMQFKPV